MKLQSLIAEKWQLSFKSKKMMISWMELDVFVLWISQATRSLLRHSAANKAEALQYFRKSSIIA